MIVKMLHRNKKQRHWAEYLPRVAFAVCTNIHKSMNYKPLVLLLGWKPKIPMECQDYGDEIKNVLDEPDISEEEKNNIIEGFQQWHFAALLANKDKIFDEVKSNIDKNQKCQKHFWHLKWNAWQCSQERWYYIGRKNKKTRAGRVASLEAWIYLDSGGHTP